MHNTISRTYDAGNNEAASFDFSASAVAAQIPVVKKRYREIVNAGSTLTRYISFGKQDPAMIARLVRDTSTSDLIFALARLCIKNIAFMLAFTGEKVGVKIVKTRDERASQATAYMQNCGAEGASFISYLLGEGRMPQAIFKLHAIHDELSARLAGTSQANLKRYHKQFQNQATQFEQQDDILHAITANYASLYTLCYVDPSLDVHVDIAAILASQAALYVKESFDFLEVDSKCGLREANMLNLENLLKISKYRNRIEMQQFAESAASAPNTQATLNRRRLTLG